MYLQFCYTFKEYVEDIFHFSLPVHEGDNTFLHMLSCDLR